MDNRDRAPQERLLLLLSTRTIQDTRAECFSISFANIYIYIYVIHLHMLYKEWGKNSYIYKDEFSYLYEINISTESSILALFYSLIFYFCCCYFFIIFPLFQSHQYIHINMYITLYIYIYIYKCEWMGLIGISTKYSCCEPFSKRKKIEHIYFLPENI